MSSAYTINSFKFTAVAPPEADVVVVVDETLRSKSELFACLARGLSFPDYFGSNWDALVDCLSDLSWWPGEQVIIDHAGIPSLSPGDLTLYLERLVDASERGGARQLRLVFRERDRTRLAAALSESA